MPPRHQLFVLRHAKSSWDDAALDDHARPLAPRGLRATDLLREHLRREQIRPTLVLSSTASRARETLERIEPGGEQEFEPELYGASERSLTERLREVPERVNSVMVVGHNPGLHELVFSLSGGAASAARKFPTAALATLTFDCRWDELGPGKATLAGLVRPKDLE